MFEAVPPEVKACPQWLVWRRVWLPDKHKFTKQPLSPYTGMLASVTKAADWSSFDHASNVYQLHRKPGVVDGIGFVFGHKSDILGVDLDKVLNEQGQVVDYRAHAIADKLGSYTELSPSGTGLHVLARGKLVGGRRRENIEVYGEGRYFTVTGVPYGVPRAITDQQEAITQLVKEIDDAREANTAANIDWSVAPKYTDEQLWHMARSAENGEKFFKLWNGAWQEFYSSQSEADFALIDIIAFYSDAPSQVQNMFMLSALGQRDKARERPGYVVGMIKRSFDRKVPLVAIPALPVVHMSPGHAIDTPPVDTTLDPEEIEEGYAKAHNPYQFPPGLVGEIASWCWQQSRWPMEELCLVAALGTLAGIVGRQYQYDKSGLNLYLMLLAGTGAGKEALSASISKIFSAVTAPETMHVMPGQPAPIGFKAAEGFYGPTQLTGKGLLRFFNNSNTLSCVSVIPEFSQQLSRMAHPNAHTGDKEFQQVLLDFYMKSSEGIRYTGAMNSDEKKDIKTLVSPSFSLVCEGTPERFWTTMDDQKITDGLMSRFIVFERDGYDMPRNNHSTEAALVPQELKLRVAALCEHVLKLQTTADTRINILIHDNARQYSNELEDYYRKRGINGRQNVYNRLWFRAHQNAVRLAALVAVGCDMYQPVITVEHLRWANAIVYRQAMLLIGKFRRGEVGQQDNSERDQLQALRELLQRWLETSPETHAGVSAWRDARTAGLVPWSFLQSRLSSKSCFKNTRLGPTEALRRAVQALERSGTLQLASLQNHAGQYYRVAL